jgi:hypothetical protein
MGFLSGLEKTAILNFFTAQSCARGQRVFVLETLYIFELEISNKQALKTNREVGQNWKGIVALREGAW